MKTRAGERRRGERRVLLWSLLAAATLHVAAFLLWPAMAVEPLPGVQAGIDLHGAAVYVDVLFGPPDIFEADGSLSEEPPERVLEVDRILSLRTGCPTLTRQGRPPAHGSARLRIGASGDAELRGVHESTGDACADEVLAVTAGALKYHWLPSARFPSPVDLIQPVTLFEARELSIRLPTRRGLGHEY